MNNVSFNLTGGVLVIGSLLWQDDLGKEKNIRKEWRRKFLDENGKIKVYAPIRYGRLSSGNVYTMTFSNWAIGDCLFYSFSKKLLKTLAS